MVPRVHSAAAAARQLPDNLLTSQAEPRLLSGAVRHSLHLGEEEEEEGQGGEREDTETSLGGRDGRKERKSGRCHSTRGGSRDQSPDRTTAAGFRVQMEGQEDQAGGGWVGG